MDSSDEAEQLKALEILQKCFEISQKAYGEDFNVEGSEILLSQAKINLKLKKYEQCEALIEKAKSIEEKVSSKYSDRYKKIKLVECSIKNSCVEGIAKEKELKTINYNWRIAAAIGLTAIGVTALWRYKQNDK